LFFNPNFVHFCLFPPTSRFTANGYFIAEFHHSSNVDLQSLQAIAQLCCNCWVIVMSTVFILRHMVKEDENTLNAVFGVEVLSEHLQRFGKSVEIKKAALQARYVVAWVLNNQSSCCMSCDKNFGLLRWKHHCRKCGYLVCHACSPSTTAIPELNEVNGSRICKTCEKPKSGSFAIVVEKNPPHSPGTESVGTDTESRESKGDAE
jgi:hypothetical protein